MSDRLYKKKPNGTWYAWFYGPDGKRKIICTRTRDRRAALRVLRRAERDAAANDSLPASRATSRSTQRRSPTTLEQALQRLVDLGCHDLAPGTVRMYVQKAGHLVRLLGKHTIGALDRDRVQRYIDTRLREQAHPSSVYKELVTLRRALRLAYERGELSTDPTIIIPKFRARYRPRDRYLHPEELEALLSALPKKRRPWVLVAVYTGARASEVEALRWREHIDLDAGWILLPGTKTARARRWVPIAPPLADLLHPAASATGPVVERWHNVRRDLAIACKHADIDPCTPNDLRRTYASWLKQAGVDSLVVARLLGHTSTRMVEAVYGHLNDPVYIQAVATLPAPGTATPGSKWVADTSTPKAHQTRHSACRTHSKRQTAATGRRLRCPGAESNHRHADFQSAALPTELPGQDCSSR